MASRNARTITILCMLLLATIISTVVLAVLYAEKLKDDKNDLVEITTQSPNTREPQDATTQAPTDVDLTKCGDVAIIGAGIAGSYSAWRLRNQGHKITVYEYSDRIGGRCHTVKFPHIPDVNIELGAMRFKPNSHPLMNRTLQALGLEAADFPMGSGYHPDSLIYIRGQHLRHKHIGTVSVLYDLGDHMNKDFDQLNWEIFANNTDIDPDIEGFADDPMHIRSMPDGVELWKQSVQGFYLKYGNADTLEFLQDVGYWDADYGNVSAAQFVVKSKPDNNQGQPEPIKVIATGFQSMPEAMIEEFLNAGEKHALKKNHHLKSIRKHEDKYILTFQPTQTVSGATEEIKPGHPLSSKPVHTCAKKVILAVGRMALEHIDWDVFKQPELHDYITNSIRDAHAGKLYFASPTKWWADYDVTPRLTVSTTPLRQTFDFAKSESTGNYVLNACYTDSNKYTSFWRELSQQRTKYPGTDDVSLAVSHNTIDTARKFLAEVYNVTKEEIPAPSYALMGLWDRYPFGAAWYQWRPYYDWYKVEAKMLRPSANDDVFIPSNAFSAASVSGWTEGALQKVEEVMKYFDV